MQPLLTMYANKAEADVALECERAGWRLELLGVHWVVTKAGEPIGMGDTPRGAYLAACETQQRSPF